jgi:CBS domain containing-hemolysin-like protein
MMEPPDSDLRRILLIIFLCVLVLLSLIFSASESAFLSINKLRVRFLRGSKRGSTAALCGKLLSNKEKLLHTMLIGNNIVNILLTALLTSLALELFGSAGLGVATAASTVILLLFGEIAPKTFASHYPEKTAFMFSRIVAVVAALLTPLTALLAAFLRIFAQKQKEDSSFTAEEIKTFIEIGEEEGVLEKHEKTMMHKVLSFTKITARDIMKPRTKIAAVTLNASYRGVLELSQRTRLSRFPVCADGIDHIAGVLYVKDMLAYKNDPALFSVQKIMRRPLFIPGTKNIFAAQQALKENKQSLAIVIDEYSGTAGILSIDDIAREIFGKIADEYDSPAEQSIVQTAQGEYVCDASVKLSTLAEKTGVALASAYYETLAGFMLEKLDAVPQAGGAVSVGAENSEQVLLTVIDVTDRKIQKVRIQKLRAKNNAAGGDAMTGETQ